MIKHVCDKCGADIAEPLYLDGIELCKGCYEEAYEVLNKWLQSKAERDSGIKWHDQRLGFPNVKGLYLLTMAFDNMGEEVRDIRIGRYAGFPYWYRAAKTLTLIENSGGKVIAWAELPEAYKESEGKEIER